MYRFFVPLLLAGAIQAQVVVVTAGRGWYHKPNPKDPYGKSFLLTRKYPDLKEGDTLTGGRESGDLVLGCPRQDGLMVYGCSSATCDAHACVQEKFLGLKVTLASFPHPAEIMFGALLKREPAELAVAAVRGSGGPGDAVVIQTAQGVHWAPALIRVLEGRYCFRLSHLPASASSREFTIDWDRSVEKEGIALVPNLAAGLYRFEKGMPAANGACRLDVDSTPAWVLVTPQARFEAIDKQWEEDSSKIDGLEQNGVSTNALTALRHSVLAGLADSVESR